MKIDRHPTLYRQIHASALQNPQGNALLFYGTALSYRQLDHLIDQCAAGLLALGVTSGDRVTICMPNLPQTVAAIYAVNRIGAVCNMLHPLSTSDEVRHGVELVRSKVAFCFDLSEKAFDGLDVALIRCKTCDFFEKAPMGWIRGKVYAHSIRQKVGTAHVTKSLSWEQFLDQGKAWNNSHSLPDAASDPESTAAIMYTGGTTGLPKGVMLSNAAINSLSFQLFPVLGEAKETDGMLGALPVFHGFGFAFCMHTALAAGIRLALLPRFDAKECCRIITKHRLTFLFSVPSFFERLLKCGFLDGEDLSYVRFIGSGGDVVSDDLRQKMDKLLEKGGSPCKFLTGYGLTESVTACCFTDPYSSYHTGCIGVPMEGNEMKVVRMGTTETLPEGDGEICVTGPTLMQGYWEDPEETSKVLRRHEDGRIWLHTGDVGCQGEGGIYFRQRLKRVLKVSGYLVYPSAIEEKLRCSSLVEDCCVVGMDTPKGTRVKAYVVPQREPQSDQEREKLAQEITGFSREHLNLWSVPAQVEFLSELPHTKLGKVDYKALQ